MRQESIKRCRRAACRMGLAGRLGRNGEQSGSQLPSLPSGLYLSLSIPRKLAEKSGCILNSGRKTPRYPGEEGVGAGGVCEAGVGAGGGEQEAQAFQRTGAEPQLQAVQEPGRGDAILALLGKVSLVCVGEKQPGRPSIGEGEFGK